MEAKTLQALKESIAHWERMRDGDAYGGEEPTDLHCALCQLFNNENTSDVYRCEDCPIYEDTGRKFCSGTPYIKAQRLWATDNPKFPKEAQKMIDYLKSLLPTTEQEGCGE